MPNLTIPCPLCGDSVTITRDGLGGYDATDHDGCAFVWVDLATAHRVARSTREAI